MRTVDHTDLDPPVDYQTLNNAQLSLCANQCRRAGLPLPLDLLAEMDQRGWDTNDYQHGDY